MVTKRVEAILIAFPKVSVRARLPRWDDRAHQRDRRSDSVSGDDLNSGGNEARLVSAGNVRKCHCICEKCRRYRALGLDPCLDQRLYRLPLTALSYCAAARPNRRASFGILDAMSGGTTRV